MRPPEYQGRPRPNFRLARGPVVRLALLVFIVIAALQSISFYVESLWYGSLGFQSVFWYRLRAQSLVFLAVAAITATVLWLLFRAVTPAAGYSRRPFLEIGGEAIVIPTSETVRRLALPAAAIFGVFFGIAFTSDWNTFALFLNRTSTPGIVDPIFGRQLSFYLFTLPVLDAVAGWLLAIGVIVLIAAVLLAATDMLATFKGVSLALSLLLIVVAFQVYLSRYKILLQENSFFSGVRYVDHETLLDRLTVGQR